MRQPFRLLVTGSRIWDDTGVIEHVSAPGARRPGALVADRIHATDADPYSAEQPC
jgi:hypothetical protein